MDSFFGIGLPELVLILIIAGVVMGPERITVAARWMGKTSVQLQGITRTFLRQLNNEVGNVDGTGELRGTVDELNSLRRQIEELQAEFKASATGLTAAATRTTAAPNAEPENLIAPPQLQQQSNADIQSIRPPSLVDEQPSGNGHAQPPAPALSSLPNRATSADDPD